MKTVPRNSMGGEGSTKKVFTHKKRLGQSWIKLPKMLKAFKLYLYYSKNYKGSKFQEGAKVSKVSRVLVVDVMCVYSVIVTMIYVIDVLARSNIINHLLYNWAVTIWMCKHIDDLRIVNFERFALFFSWEICLSYLLLEKFWITMSYVVKLKLFTDCNAFVFIAIDKTIWFCSLWSLQFSFWEVKTIYFNPFKLFVKLQSHVQTSVLGLGVDFVCPCHNNKNNKTKNNKKNPHQNLSEGDVLEVWHWRPSLILISL